ncbi:unnamed protein product [Clonostachys rhizophaga]|uniref:DUF6604 domain-containing protein n=1 Tax=Clonostachys rhizophaga TaxID=160324 RepID=A0A9N9YJF1_9HYPO|nr:unnamed protein product [Clonostachys rhizophaga]
MLLDEETSHLTNAIDKVAVTERLQKTLPLKAQCSLQPEVPSRRVPPRSFHSLNTPATLFTLFPSETDNFLPVIPTGILSPDDSHGNPKKISSIYRQYKNDTDSLASWLASTARHHGYPLAPLLRSSGNTSTAKSTGRLKGKARREAHNAGPKPAKYIIPLHDFTQLANFIAKKRQRIDVPSSLISTLNRLNTLRAGFAKLLAQHGQAFNSESEARHQHFVNALKDVRSILQPHPSVETEEQSKPASEDEKAPKPPGGGLMNRFSALSVDEPSQDFLERFAKECDHAARPSQLVDDVSVFEADLEKAEEELMFLCSALLRDSNEIRSYIHPMWPHKETTWDPGAFSVSTNVAIYHSAADLLMKLSLSWRRPKEDRCS